MLTNSRTYYMTLISDHRCRVQVIRLASSKYDLRDRLSPVRAFDAGVSN